MPSDRLSELKRKLDVLREDLRRAIEKAQLVDRMIEDLGMAHPDGTKALRESNQVRSLATELYIKALREFSDFVLGEARAQASSENASERQADKTRKR